MKQRFTALWTAMLVILTTAYPAAAQVIHADAHAVLQEPEAPDGLGGTVVTPIVAPGAAVGVPDGVISVASVGEGCRAGFACMKQEVDSQQAVPGRLSLEFTDNFAYANGDASGDIFLQSLPAVGGQCLNSLHKFSLVDEDGVEIGPFNGNISIQGVTAYADVNGSSEIFIDLDAVPGAAGKRFSEIIVQNRAVTTTGWCTSAFGGGCTNHCQLWIDSVRTLEPDYDFDGVPDVSDNCIEVANADQADTDPVPDGFGNRCDPDVENTGGYAFLWDGWWQLWDYCYSVQNLAGTYSDPTEAWCLEEDTEGNRVRDIPGPSGLATDFNVDGRVDDEDGEIIETWKTETGRDLGDPPGPSCVTQPGGCQP